MVGKWVRFAPRRGWRAFIGEVGIIVLGVLVAVAIGKVVEALDWREKVSEADATLRSEIQATSGFNIVERLRVTPCLRKQLDILRQAVIDSGPRGAEVPLIANNQIPRVYVHPSRSWYEGSWDSVVADNLPSHMAADDREFYKSFYNSMRRLDRLNDEEGIVASELMPLHEPIALDQATKIEMLQIIARERWRVEIMALMASQAQRVLTEKGQAGIIKQSDLPDLLTEGWCRRRNLLNNRG